MVDSFLAGSVSGCCTVLLLQPLDTIKTLRQLPQLHKTPHNVAVGKSYENVVSILAAVKKREMRISSLWRGTAPSLYRCIPGLGAYFSSIELLRGVMAKPGRPESMVSNLLIGFSARGIGSVITLPLTIVKTRFESGWFAYRSVPHALTEVSSREGIRGLFSGGLATVLRDAPYAGLFVLFYFEMKRHAAESWGGEKKIPFFVTFGCGISSGFLASVLTHPFDVIKTRIQVNAIRTDLFKTVAHILGEGGARGMMTGLTVRMVRKMLVSAFNWTFYENISRQVKLYV